MPVYSTMNSTKEVTMFTILLVILALWNVAIADHPCPQGARTHSCICYSEDEQPDHPVVFCSRIHGIDELKEVLQVMKGQNFSLELQESILGDIPSDLFQGQTLHEVIFQECEITSFGEGLFSGLEDTLASLHFYDSIKEENTPLETIPFKQLKNLISLSIEENFIDEISNDLFADAPTSLQSVSLGVNDIQKLGDKAFAPLINLKQIWLEDNQITEISRSMFPNPANELYALELGLLNLKSLPNDIFQNMPALRIINLTGNKFKSLPQGPWVPVWNQLDEVYVDYNRELICDQQIRWIYERKLPNVFHGRCFGNNDLSGKQLTELTLDDFDDSS